MSQIISKQAIRVALHCTNADERRDFAQHVFIEPTGGTVMATDGMIAIKVTEPHKFPVTDFPVVPGAPALDGADARVAIPANVAKRLAKASKTPIPILNAIQVGQPATGAPVAIATDLQVPQIASLPAGNDAPTLPDIDRARPDLSGPAVQVCFSAEMLGRLAALAKEARSHARALSGVMLTIPLPAEMPAAEGDDPVRYVHNSAVRFELKNSDLTIDGLVMPCRV